MKLRLERLTSDGDSTLGILSQDGRFVCFTLEDEFRTQKVAGETRIPAGTYDVELRDECGLTQKYASRYPGIHRGMLWLRDVDGFEYIYIHVGNRDEDTEGCILVGDTAVATRGDMMVGSSRTAYTRLYPTWANAAEAEHLQITIVDRDR